MTTDWGRGFLNPWLMTGMGILAGNQGETGNVAFSNAMGSGLQALGIASTLGQRAYLDQQRLRERRLEREETMRANEAREALARERLALTREAYNQPDEQTQRVLDFLSKTPEEQEAYLDVARQLRDVGVLGSSGINVNVGEGGTTGVEYGSVPSAMVRRTTEEGGTQLEPEPGSELDVKRRMSVEGLADVYRDLEEFEDLVTKHGTEAFGDVGRRMRSLRNRVVGNVQQFREVGVLEPGELRRLEEELPSGEAILTTGPQILPLIKGFREEVGRKLETKKRLYGLEGGLPSGWKVREVTE